MDCRCHVKQRPGTPGYSSAWTERAVWGGEVGSSNLSTPIVHGIDLNTFLSVRCMPRDSKHKQAQREWYLRNREMVLKSSHEKRIRNNAWVNEQKNKPCADCGGTFPACVMDFHHRDPKTKIASIAKAVSCMSRAALIEEIAKCDLICANCHRIREYC